MIVFRTLRYKNFLASGNAWTTIALDKSDRTLICGDNGAGKTTLLDALTFVLFNKPFRNVTLPQLVNSINEKNCLVELDFTAGGHEYKVVRGLAPKRFEIWKDGVAIQQESKTKDYQRFLEDQILKLNYKSFCQVVILGSTNYVPFMRLPAADRRQIVETLLDINVFSSMNATLKERLASIRTELATVDSALDTQQTKVQVAERYIDQLEHRSKASLDAVVTHIDSTRAELDQIMRQIDDRRSSMPDAGDSKPLVATKRKIENLLSQINGNQDRMQKRMEFFENHSNCPVCFQPVAERHRQQQVEEAKSKTDEYKSAAASLREKAAEMDAKLAEIDGKLAVCRRIEKEILGLEGQIGVHRAAIEKLERQLKDMRSGGDDVKDERALLETYKKELSGFEERRKMMVEERHYGELAGVLLRDGGIKSRIIRQYLPVMNKLINKFLSSMDFYVQFTLDDEFNETIKSRHRDEFSYASFSEGEKLRIDLSLLLSWREVAKMKNSVNCNLLILDEVFDSSLDAVGTEEFMKLLQTMGGGGANIFVISHKADQLVDKFNDVVVFVKRNGFSVLEN